MRLCASVHRRACARLVPILRMELRRLLCYRNPERSAWGPRPSQRFDALWPTDASQEALVVGQKARGRPCPFEQTVGGARITKGELMLLDRRYCYIASYYTSLLRCSNPPQPMKPPPVRPARRAHAL